MKNRLQVSGIMTGIMICFFLLNSYCQKSIVRTPISVLPEDQGLWILENGRRVFYYQKTTESLNGKYPRANYIHPLLNLDGDTLTEDFPKGHYHHRGVFWAWHQLWIGDQWICDPWAIKNIKWDVIEVETRQNQDGSLSLSSKVFWKSPRWLDENNEMKSFVEEQTTIRVFREQDDIRKIDFTIRLLALEENLRIGGSDDEKGYGGFSLRIKLSEDMQFISQNGLVTPLKTAVEAGPWMQFYGSFDDDRKTGLTLMCHPEQPGFPQPWILRKQGSMQNPVYPGSDPVHLSTISPLLLKYRILVHRKEITKNSHDSLFTQYCMDDE